MMTLDTSNTYEKYDRLTITEEFADVLSRTEPDDMRGVPDDVWRKANVEAVAKLQELFKEMTKHGMRPSYAVGAALAEAVRFRKTLLRKSA